MTKDTQKYVCYKTAFMEKKKNTSDLELGEKLG
jgi:hypothetical protein